MIGSLVSEIHFLMYSAKKGNDTTHMYQLHNSIGEVMISRTALLILLTILMTPFIFRFSKAQVTSWRRIAKLVGSQANTEDEGAEVAIWGDNLFQGYINNNARGIGAGKC